MTNPGKIILSPGKYIRRIYKTIAVIIRSCPVAPVVATDWLVQVEDVAAAAINIGLRWVVDEVIVVDLVVVAGRAEVDSIVVRVGGVACQGVAAGRAEEDSIVVRVGGVACQGVAAGRVEVDSTAGRGGGVACQGVAAGRAEEDSMAARGGGVACQGVAAGRGEVDSLEG